MTTDPADLPLRMALADEYRRIRQGSQAARWGIATPGWARKHEIEELRRWLIGEEVDGRRLRSLLMISHDARVPPEVEDLVPEAARGPQPPDRGDAGCLPLALAVIGVLFTAVTTGQALITLARGDLGPTSSVVEEATRAVLSLGVTLVFSALAWALLRRDLARDHRETSRVRFTSSEEDALLDRLREVEPRAARGLERARTRRTSSSPPPPFADAFEKWAVWGFFLTVAIGVATAIAGALGLAFAVVAARVLLSVVVGSVLLAIAWSLVKEARGAGGAVDLAGWTFSLLLVVGVGLYLFWHFVLLGNWG
jgi:hypothetical protein